MTWHETKSFLSKIKRCVWNKRLQLWWHQLWTRKDEFHRSLSLDPEAMMETDGWGKGRYLTDLNKRRKIAHQEDLAGFKERENELSFLLNSFKDEDDAEKIGILNEKLEEDIIQAIRRRGLNITKEHFRAIMRIWGIEEIETMMRIKMKDPRREGLYKFISPEAKKWNRDLVTAILGKFVSSKEYQERERNMGKVLAELK